MDVYASPSGAGNARQSNWWTCIETDQPRQDMASICMVRDIPGNEKAIISYVDGPQLAPTPSNFWDVLCKWQRTWMWNNLQWVEDNDWIAMAIAKGTCMALTDGSYIETSPLIYTPPLSF
jgi:hypothetical protein